MLAVADVCALFFLHGGWAPPEEKALTQAGATSASYSGENLEVTGLQEYKLATSQFSLEEKALVTSHSLCLLLCRFLASREGIGCAKPSMSPL